MAVRKPYSTVPGENMADNWRSKLITAGVARSPNRAMLRAVDFKDGDFEKPIVGVANGHSNMNPCNAGIQPLVDRAMRALREAGAMPQVFGTPTVTDGIGMGTDGMKYSLVSREVIADAIETAVNGQMMDGALVIGACDKNMPGGMMAMARMNVPAIYVYGGTIKPGNWKGQALTIASAFEAVGAFTAGKLSQEDFDGIEKNACPTVGACGGMFTANTMSSSFEALGLSLLGSSQLAAIDPQKADSAADSARVLVNAIKKNIRPRDIITRKSIENVVSLVMATGGSTNAVLHYLAIASAADVEWTIDDFERIRRKVPVLCDLKPSGKYVAVDFHKAGGVRRDRNRGQRTNDGWSPGDRRLRQEHARRSDGNGAHERAGDLCLRQHHQLRERDHGGDHGQEDQGRRSGGDPL